MTTARSRGAHPRPAVDGSHGSGVMRAQRPRPRLEPARVSHHLLQPRGPGSPALLNAYTTWRDGWLATFRELKAAEDLASDEFTRLDQISVLTTEGRCISVIGLRWLDLSLPMSLHDSYFRAWPQRVLDSLGTGLLCIGCNAMIAPDWRGTLVCPPGADPVPLKDLTVRMSLRSFVASQARVYVAVARNDRGMDRVASDLGSRRMARIMMHGIESDICGWARSDVVDLGPLVEDLWARRSSGSA